MKPPKHQTIDEYLAPLPDDQRATLEALRATIRALAPGAEECTSYGMPAFRLDGKVIAGFAARAHGCSYYPFSGTTLKTLASELAKYEQTKGALHFSPARPLPRTLVRKLVKARMAEGD